MLCLILQICSRAFEVIPSANPTILFLAYTTIFLNWKNWKTSECKFGWIGFRFDLHSQVIRIQWITLEAFKRCSLYYNWAYSNYTRHFSDLPHSPVSRIIWRFFAKPLILLLSSQSRLHPPWGWIKFFAISWEINKLHRKENSKSLIDRKLFSTIEKSFGLTLVESIINYLKTDIYWSEKLLVSQSNWRSTSQLLL